MPVHVPVYQEPAFNWLIPVKVKSSLCDCPVTEMEPIDFYTNGQKRQRCTNCNRVIPYSHVVEYDKFYGNNGFDEVADCE